MESEVRHGRLMVHGSNEEKKVAIIDNGEGYDPEIKGSIPNHDKISLDNSEEK